MTRLAENISLEGAIEEFLRETWPAEDRFDDWGKYIVFNFGGNRDLIAAAVARASRAL